MIGAFRVVAANDLRDNHGRSGDVRHADLEWLRSAGLIRTVTPLERGNRTVLLTLTEQGRDVLKSHRSRRAGSDQTSYGGAVNTRELPHDAHLHRAYGRVAVHEAAIVNERVQVPDFWIDYERPDGRREVQDDEITTVHYCGMHASRTVAAGFTRCCGSTARAGGSSTNAGSPPVVPDIAAELP